MIPPKASIKKAISLNDKDCRGYWFLAYHYALSNEIVKSVTGFDKAVRLVNENTGNDFWQEYAFAMMLASKPAHCRYGLDQFKKHGGKTQLSLIMDSTLKTKMLPTDPDLTYQPRNLWHAGKPALKKADLTSFVLGIKFSVDTSWNIQPNPWSNKLTAIVITPPAFTSDKGVSKSRQIGISIGLVIHAAGENEQLKDFMASMMKGAVVKDNAFALPDREGISYTFKDASVYADRGGAHIHFIGIERSQPAYPGYALEDRPEEMKTQAGKIEYQTLNKTRTRLPGRIFYFWVLDTCEDIHEASWAAFTNMMQSVKLD